MYHGTTTTVYSRTMQVNLAGELALGSRDLALAVARAASHIFMIGPDIPRGGL